MAFGDEVVANYNLSSAVAVFNDVPTVGWWTFDILIGFIDGHALQTEAGTLTLDAMTGESGGTGYSEGGSAEVIFKASGKTGVHYTTPLRYFSGTPYATLTLLSSNASDTSVEVSVTPRRVEAAEPAENMEELVETLVTALPALTWLNPTRTLSDGAITSATFDGSSAFPQAAAVPDVNVASIDGDGDAPDLLTQFMPILLNLIPYITKSQGNGVLGGALSFASSTTDESLYVIIRNASLKVWDGVVEAFVDWSADDFLQYPIDTVRVDGTQYCYVPSTYVSLLPAGWYVIEWKRTAFNIFAEPMYSETRSPLDPTVAMLTAYWNGTQWRNVHDLGNGALTAATYDGSTAYPQTAAVPDVNVTKLSGSAPAADALETAALASGGIATAEGVSETVEAYINALSGADGDTLKTISDQIDAIPTGEGVADEVWSATTRTLTATAGAGPPVSAKGACDIYAKVYVNGTQALSCPVDYWTGDPIVQADIDTITYSIFLLGEKDQTDRTDVAGHIDVALDKTSVVYDTLQTDGLAAGWNFRRIPDVSTNAAFTEAGRAYLAEYKITPTSGQVIIVRFKLQCI